MLERIVQMSYIDDTRLKARFVEVSDEMVALFEQWAASQGVRVEWRAQDPCGLVANVHEWRDLMQRLQDLLQVKVCVGDLRQLKILTAAVARLEAR
jgi:hypothetical protein